MPSYVVKKLLLRAAIALPTPRFLYRACRLYQNARDGENFGDMTINGEVRFLRSQADACRVLFDVGAHRGEWTKHALAATEDARIHCFEPITSLYEALVERRFPRRVVCNPFGLSDEAGERRIQLAAMSLHGALSMAGEDLLMSPTEAARFDTLDDYCGGREVGQIDFLKLDVEGHEMAVLLGGREMLREGRIKRIQFEYGPSNIHSRVLLGDFFSFLDPLDFDLYKITPRGLVDMKTYDRRLENFQYKNFAALHRSLEMASNG